MQPRHTKPATSTSLKFDSASNIKSIRNQPPHNHAVQKYLDNYAEIETQYLTDFPDRLVFQHVLVIPCYKESSELVDRLHRTFNHVSDLLVILIVNQPQSDADTAASEKLWAAIVDYGEVQWHSNNVYFIRKSDCAPNFLAIQRFHDPLKLPPKQGVGLARKIGCDIAAALIWKQQIADNWIYSSDADAHWPEDYFERLRSVHCDSTTSCSAAVFPFQHQRSNSALGLATELYQQSLHYYVEGIRWAGSPYAFHTIGSCLALDFKSYCRVRGFPKRSGGEDFYVLNKLAKLGNVAALSGEAIELEARESDRVPFGTGPAAKKIMALAEPEVEFQSYNPLVFAKLRQWLATFPNLWELIHQQQQGTYQILNTLPTDTVAALESLGFQNCVEHQRQQIRHDKESIKHLHYWFDGFRTLKFIHYLQQNSLPAVPLLQALKGFDQIKKQHP